MIDENPKLDGILSAMDIQGLGTIRALTELRIIFPEQVKIISLTGHAVGGMLETSMTSMKMPAHEMGEKAAEMVITGERRVYFDVGGVQTDYVHFYLDDSHLL